MKDGDILRQIRYIDARYDIRRHNGARKCCGEIIIGTIHEIVD
jgi:hypothetical protein